MSRSGGQSFDGVPQWRVVPSASKKRYDRAVWIIQEDGVWYLLCRRILSDGLGDQNREGEVPSLADILGSTAIRCFQVDSLTGSSLSQVDSRLVDGFSALAGQNLEGYEHDWPYYVRSVVDNYLHKLAKLHDGKGSRSSKVLLLGADDKVLKPKSARYMADIIECVKTGRKFGPISSQSAASELTPPTGEVAPSVHHGRARNVTPLGEQLGSPTHLMKAYRWFHCSPNNRQCRSGRCELYPFSI